jgi:hypothetical protein
MASPVVQLRVPEDMLAAVDGTRGDGTRSAWILALIERELLGKTPAPSPAVSSLAAIPDGEPSPGVACAGPGCWQRNTSRYGLRRVPLCPACRAALQGQPYEPPASLALARALRGNAA